jgi:hypothetical protein
VKQTWANRVKEHVHFNWDVLEIITKGGGGNMYLADDGTYKVVSGGGGGIPVVGEYRHDWVAPYSYCGTAPTGALDTDPVWQIDRLEITNTGDVILSSAFNTAWTNRLTATYSPGQVLLQTESDWVSPYSYCGVAPIGVPQTDPFWHIDRIQVNNNGSTTTLTANNVAWTNRYIVPYT